jgi:hypothetical protein
MTERKMTEKKTSTMFCKICQDAGKPLNEYTNHNIRSGGIVTCKTLINTVCRNCKNKGHTLKYCPVDKPDIRSNKFKPTTNYFKKEKTQNVNEIENKNKNVNEIENKNKNVNYICNNRYKYLGADEDDEEQIITNNIQDEMVSLQLNPDVIAKPILIRCCNKNQCGANVSDDEDEDDSIEDKDKDKDMLSYNLKRAHPAPPRRWCDYSSDEEE